MNCYTIEDHYNTKKKCATDRGIDWNFTMDEFKAFWSLRNTQRCFYTNSNFKLVKNTGVGTPDLYPTIERIDQSMPYGKPNCIWVTLQSNKCKARFIEQGESTKGQAPRVLKMINKIKKVLNNKQQLAESMVAYWDVYADVKVKNSVLIKQQNAEKKLLESKEAEAKKWEDELSFAKHYISIVEELSQVGVELQITLGTLKKSLGRCNKCQVSGEVFTNIEDKWLFIINKSLPVTSDNVKVTTRNVRNAMDLLTRVCTIDKLALNIHKIQNKEK